MTTRMNATVGYQVGPGEPASSLKVPLGDEEGIYLFAFRFMESTVNVIGEW